MNKITSFQVPEKDGTLIDWIKIDRGNDEFTWMPKSVYDEQQALSGNLI
jgi:hypothetical protein